MDGLLSLSLSLKKKKKKKKHGRRTWPIGTALAGVAGALVSVSFSVDPSMGMHWTLKSLIVMVLGGLGSFIGTFLGGILLGATESATGFFISGNYRQVVGLVLFVLILIFRPQGLFGAKEK